MKFKTRTGYAICAFLMSLLVVPIWGVVLWASDGFGEMQSMDVTPRGVLEFVAMLGLPAAASAALCWPYKTKRSKKRMALAGVLTVGLSFILIALVSGAAVSIAEGNFSPMVIASSTMIFVMIGSVLTLGIPYALGALASLLFADNIKALDSKSVRQSSQI